jgi:hypothetical protein
VDDTLQRAIGHSKTNHLPRVFLCDFILGGIRTISRDGMTDNRDAKRDAQLPNPSPEKAGNRLDYDLPRAKGRRNYSVGEGVGVAFLMTDSSPFRCRITV